MNRISLIGLAAVLLAGQAVATAATDAPVFDVPRLDNVTIDGKADDWGDRGFRVDALAPVNGGLRPADNFAANFRAGWNDKGLLVLVTARDDLASEGSNPKELWQKDSIELFWGTKVGVRDWVQTHIGPGVDPKTPEIRTNIDDHRESADLRGIEPKITVARTKTAGGYVLEALLPWDCLKIKPEKNREVAFQIVVNDVDGDGPRAQLMWYPEEGAYSDAGKMHRVRLSDQASPAVRIAALPNYGRFPRTSLFLVAPPELAGKQVEARDGRSALGSAVLKAADGWATGTLTLRGIPTGVVTLSQGGGPLALRDPEALRKQAFAGARLRFDSYVFAGAAFPGADFENPERMEQVIGPYTAEVDYYDASMKKSTSAPNPGRYGAVVSIKSRDGKFSDKRYVTLYRAKDMPDWNAWHGDFSLPLPAGLGIDPAVAAEQKSSSVEEYVKESFFDGMDENPDTAVFLAGLAERKPGDPPVQRLSARESDRRWWFALKQKIGDAYLYPHLVQTPKGYDADPNKKWPLLLFLHGAGERGDDLKLAATHGPLKYLREGHDLPFVIVTPQCASGDWWLPARVGALLEVIQNRYRIDPDRVYLTGLSMGGFGTWSTALEYPDRFAAIAPICGGGDPLDAARIVNIPVWDFHGAKDTTVPIRLSEEMVAALKKAGAKEVEFTVYPDAGHDAWTETYDNPKLYEWLLSHKRGQ
jgi:predicted esterase